ncbi:MAG TPA: hypothetical protein VH253_08935 [Phycisphaerae bacterium]|nr:hypothetical protein [Phycisphaerae bacterium]
MRLMTAAGVVLMSVVVMMAAARGARGQTAGDLDKEHDAEASQAPSGVTFALTLDKPAYHLGERVAMTYRVTSGVEGKYTFDGGMYDRSGRMWEDTFHVEPRDLTDPLAAFFSLQGPWMGGGLRSMPTLGEKPVELHFDLNEWVSFDHAGKYRLYVTAQRITEKGDAHEVKSAVSDIVSFEVLPADAGWSRGQLEEIRRILDGNPNEEAERDAVRRLRFLNTPEASMEMAKRLDGSVRDAWDLEAGLVGVSDRKAALEAMEQRLVAEDQAVTPRFLTTLQILAVLEEPGTSTRPADMRAHLAENRERMRTALASYMPRLKASLADKKEKARAVTLAALEQEPANEVFTPDAGMAEALAAVFEMLPVEDQIRALQGNWEATKSAAMLPHLLKIVQGSPGTGMAGLQLRNWALVRAYELDPKGVRPVVLAEMKHPVSSDSYGLENRLEGLLVLPDETLPEMDDDFVRLMGSGGLHVMAGEAHLLARYGTATIEPEMVKIFEAHAGRWACDVQSGMLAYFLRVDPAYGQETFTECLASRQTGCWRDLFEEVGRQVWTPELESLACESLDDKDANVAISAATMLKRRGSPRVAGVLIEALGRKYVANPSVDQMAPKDPEMARRTALVDALVHGHRWVLTNQQLAAAEAKAGSAELVQACRDEAALTEVPLQVSMGTDGRFYGYIHGEPYRSLEEVETKISAYPADFPIRLNSGAMADAAVRQFRDWAAGQGRMVK